MGGYLLRKDCNFFYLNFASELHIQGWAHGACGGSLPLPLRRRRHLRPPPQPQAPPLVLPLALPLAPASSGTP